MEPLAVQSLLDLCYIRTAYLLLFRNKATCWYNEPWTLSLWFSSKFLSDFQRLTLPEKVMLNIQNRMQLAVGYLPPLLSSWFPNISVQKSSKFVTCNMLYECLVLKGDGLIDQRKTAEKLIRSRGLDNVFSFRLACTNFLEKEVLQLWAHVKEFFLNRAMFQEYTNRKQYPVCADDTTYKNVSRDFHLPSYPCTTESHQVLFWIGYCLSKDNGVYLSKIPHFAGDNVNWYEFSLDSAVCFCNVACFAYFSNFSHSTIEYSNMDMIKRILQSEKKCQQSSFIFHFMRLNSEEKARLIEICPEEVISHFLQWPLSQEFVENPPRLWNLIPENLKFWIFLRLFAILFYEDNPYRKLNMRLLLSDCSIHCVTESAMIAGVYSLDHLRGIWTDLWKISSDSYKLKFLDTVVLKSIDGLVKNRKFYYKFKLYGLQRKLRNLFLSKGETVLELYESQKLKESLINLVSKHLPEDSQLLIRNCISFLPDETEQLVFAEKNPLKLQYKVIHNFYEYNRRLHAYRLPEKFLNYIMDNRISFSKKLKK